MSGWNYRLVKSTGEYPDHMKKKNSVFETPWEYIDIREVYYDKKDRPVACTEDVVTIGGETTGEMMEVYEMMAEAFNKPVLEMSIFEQGEDDAV